MSCWERILHFVLQAEKDKMKHQYIMNNIEKKDVLLAFITKNFIKEKFRWEETQLAVEKNKIMYAIVKKGTRLKKYKKLPWRKIYYFKNQEELMMIMHKIQEDLRWIVASGGK